MRDWKEWMLDKPSHASNLKSLLKSQDLLDEFMLDGKRLWGDLTFGEFVYLFKGGTRPQCPENNNIRFISPSVGYRFCGRTGVCVCATEAMRENVSKSLTLKSAEEKASALRARKQTTQSRFGCDNVFQSDEIKGKSKQTLREVHGVENAAHIAGVSEKRKQTNLSLYGCSNPSQNTSVKERIRHTNLEKYGCENPLSDPSVQQKIRATNLKRYGVPNVAMNEKIRTKIRETNVSRHGNVNPSKSEKIISKIKQSRFKRSFSEFTDRLEGKFTPNFTEEQYKGSTELHDWTCLGCHSLVRGRLINGGLPRCVICEPRVSSKEQEEIANWLVGQGLVIEINNRSLIAPLELDIVIPARKLAIEYCGLYWHSELNGKDKKYHLAKHKLADQAGYRLITIFGDEFYDKQKVYNRLSSILRLNKRAISARKTKLIEVSNSKARMFLNAKHLMGYAPASRNFALTLDDQIVSIMTFSRARFGNTGYEMIRYASSDIVIGGAARLFKNAVRILNARKVVSYADLRWSDGALYKALGFKHLRSTAPGYWYLSDYRTRIHRLSFTKQKLLQAGGCQNKTEWQLMQESGYDRIWDCGQLVFGWEAQN